MLKIKLSQIKWCLLFIITLIINFHLTIVIMRSYEHGTVHDLGVKYHLIKDYSYANLNNELKNLESVPTSQHINVINKKDNVNEINSKSTNINSFNSPTLPAFASDYSDYALGAVIERSFDSFGPFVTTFLVSHYLLEPFVVNDMGVEKVNPDKKDLWRKAAEKFKETQYDTNGKRISTDTYTCKIKNTPTSDSYSVVGHFLPNRLTTDTNANRRVDIFRCPIESFSESLAYSKHELEVEIYLGNNRLFKYTVPWQTRRSGYLLEQPDNASKLNPWSGLSDQRNNVTYKPIVHLCVPGSKMVPSRNHLPLFLEFVSHHLLIGISHIYISLDISWESPYMKQLLRIYKSYINEGKLTIISQARDGIDIMHSTDGLSFHRSTVKTFQTTEILFLAKGQADYLAVFDIDEFFIPMLNHKTIQDVIFTVDISPFESLPLHNEFTHEKLLKKQSIWMGGKGWADKDIHPLCYLALTSRVTARTEMDISNNRNGLKDPQWLSTQFSHGFESPILNHDRSNRFSYTKFILPTRKIYQAGLSSAGACRLSPEWTTCGSGSKEELCYKDDTSSQIIKNYHNFGELVNHKGDSKTVDPDNIAMINHLIVYHPDVTASVNALLNKSIYAENYFADVLNDLRSRDLDLLLVIPKSPESTFGDPDTGSTDLTKDSRVNEVHVNSIHKWAKLYSSDEVKQSDAFASASKSDNFSIHDFHPLPRDFTKHYDGKKIVQLPEFAVNYTDYVLSSMLERESDSYTLYLTTFFMCHALLEPKVGASAAGGETIHPQAHDVWKQAMINFEQTKYVENGERVQPPFYFCRIQNSYEEGTASYITKGRFVPNRLTPDSNSNKRLDILRCPMKDTKEAYFKYPRSNHSVLVEILHGQNVLIKFLIPWKERMTGFMLTPPSADEILTPSIPTAIAKENRDYGTEDEENTPVASKFDPWKGFDPIKPDIWTHDNIYMCVPGLETAPDKYSLPLYLEFVEHHLQLGIDRLFIVASLGWKSPHMRLFLRVFEQYISENKVSFASHSYDGYDFVYSTEGLQWGRDNVKNFYVNMCTYFNKGVVNYVGVWDFDEHFIPIGSNKNIMDVINKADSPVPIPYFHDRSAVVNDVAKSWKPGQGLADNDGHPLCYMILNSYVTLFPKAFKKGYDYDNPWLGTRFPFGHEPTGNKGGRGLGFKKSIRPTRTVFQGGLHMIGACRLPAPWSGCPVIDNSTDQPHFAVESQELGTCYKQNGQLFRISATGQTFHLNHHFDEVVFDQDAKVINSTEEAYINHIQFHRFWFGATEESLQNPSHYTTQFFPKVKFGLNNRNLLLPIELSEFSISSLKDVGSTKQFLGTRETSKVNFLNSNMAELSPNNNFYTSFDKYSSLAAATTDEFAYSNWLTTLAFHNSYSSNSLYNSLSSVTNSFSSVSEGLSSVFDWSKSLNLRSIRKVDSSLSIESSIATLPIVSNDFSEYILASVIEKSNDDIYINTIMFTYSTILSLLLPNSTDILAVNKTSLDIIQHLVSTISALPSDKSFDSNTYTYRIYNNLNTEYEDLPATIEYFTDNKLKVVRCKYSITNAKIMLGDKDFVTISIMKSSHVIMSTHIPWDTRISSSLLSIPTNTVSSNILQKLDGSIIPNNQLGTYIIVSGVSISPSRTSIAVYLEFVSYHLMNGVDHIFICIALSYDSIFMKRYIKIFETYIHEGKVSIISQSVALSTDFMFNLNQLAISPSFSNYIYYNILTSFLKYQSKYLMILDINQFVIPKQFNIANQLKQLNISTSLSSCSYLIDSEVISSPYDNNILWIGKLFNNSADANLYHKYRKHGLLIDIERTEYILYNDVSNSNNLVKCVGSNNNNNGIINRDELQISQFLIDNFEQSKAIIKNSYTNDYSLKYYHKVRKDLRYRDLDLLISIPQSTPTMTTAEQLWTPYDNVWNTRQNINYNNI